MSKFFDSFIHYLKEGIDFSAKLKPGGVGAGLFYNFSDQLNICIVILT